MVPSAVDPDVECVRVDDPAAVATPPSPSGAPAGPVLCPEGYVPRRRGRDDLRFVGKVAITDGPPVRNPEPPP